MPRYVTLTSTAFELRSSNTVSKFQLPTIGRSEGGGNLAMRPSWF